MKIKYIQVFINAGNRIYEVGQNNTCKGIDGWKNAIKTQYPGIIWLKDKYTSSFSYRYYIRYCIIIQ